MKKRLLERRHSCVPGIMAGALSACGSKDKVYKVSTEIDISSI